MRTILIIILAYSTVFQASSQSTEGTIRIAKSDTADSIEGDLLINAGRCIALQSSRFVVGMLHNPKKSETVDPPIFLADGLNFEQYLVRHLKYPKLARDSNVTGIVEIAFMVDVSGFTRGLIVNKGIGYGCDKEALRVLRQMPKWVPAKVNGETVVCRLTKEIAFNPSAK